MKKVVDEEAKNGKKVLLSFAMDEMAIRERIFNQQGSIYGYVNTGILEDQEDQPATHALGKQLT